jgi:serine/threonine-protein kinase
MAPEVIMGLDADSRSDVYSFGATMYYVLTGQAPFPTASDLATLRAHVEAPLVPPSACAAHPIAADLERIVIRCLEKHPERRYQDCTEVATQLAEIDLSVVIASQARSINEPLAQETKTFEG